MDAGAWIVIFLILLSIIALIVISIKKNQDEDVGDFSPEKSTSSPSYTPPKAIKTTLSPSPSAAAAPPRAAAGSPQITFYAHSPTRQTRCCPVCDGENNIMAKFCYICGQSLL